MGLISKALKTTVVGGAATAGAFALWTRNSQFVPFSTSDPILTSPALRKYNPNNNPALQDVCIRKVPLSKIKPELLEKDGKLVEAFTAGIWGGPGTSLFNILITLNGPLLITITPGYAVQRAYLAKKYEGPSTAHQLWSTRSLRTSTYDVGTQMTDHFEILEHTPDRILVRCGDSPLKTDVRDSDGLFEVSARVNREEGVAEFGLKSIFFQGLGKVDKVPVPGWMVWAHLQYTKLLMETGIRNAMR
jgi:hypothetical protein